MSDLNDLRWKKFPVLDDGFVCLVDAMGNDASVVQAARVSYGKDLRDDALLKSRAEEIARERFGGDPLADQWAWAKKQAEKELKEADAKGDRGLIRYLMRHRHTTPFEMAEIKFLIRVPMDCWRQWIRHRTASVNEYSTRYTEAIDSQQTTKPDEWRLQAKSNKQGSEGFLSPNKGEWTGGHFSSIEQGFHEHARKVYEERIAHGIAKEQARKDLPLSTYTEAYWKIDLHNLFHFLGLRMDSHAQQEIREYATIIGEQIVKPLFPTCWEAFEDYRLHGMFLTRLDIEVIKMRIELNDRQLNEKMCSVISNVRERDECVAKLERLGLL